MSEPVSTTSVLVVDDSRAARKILTKMMNQLGFDDVRHAEHGADAMTCIDEKPPDLAMVDWNMPVMGGGELISTIRERRDLDRVKVLVVSSESSARIVYDALKAGADDYAMKPITAEVIDDKLRLLGLAP